ncbi:MAG: hypothetical protein ACKVY0_23040 [Prosthecobacter sp.]|uniref:hypothetical protein n=1 Tax=Prosthecobacter sp. TaxID=1965333 RepID=UPI0038FE335C
MKQRISHRYLLLLGLLLSGCEEGPTGVEQRVVELEARLAAKESEAADLRGKLSESQKLKPAGGPAQEVPASDAHAGVFAAAKVLAETLENQVKPRRLIVSGEVAYAGFTVKGADDDSERGVAVPFFRESSDSPWRSGWSRGQIMAALDVAEAVPAIPDKPMQVAQQAVQESPPPVPSTPPIPPQTLPGLPVGWKFDNVANQVIAPNGARMPPAPPGWSYGMVAGSAGDTPRAYVQDPQGQRKYYVEQ